MKKLVIALLLALSAWGAWAWWAKRSAASQVTYKRYRVAAGDLVQSVQATGTVQPLNRLELRPPVAGRVEQVLVREGDYVKRGQVLAWISSAERAALLDAARAQGPESLAKWEQMYKATPLLAPASGQIISRDTEPGQSVTAADKVVVISDRLVVKAQVDETDIARVRSGMEAEIRLDAYGEETVKARVGHIAYEARTVNNVTMYDVDVSPAAVPRFMRSGMTANVAFVMQRSDDTLLLPAEALQSRDGDSGVVLVPDRSGKREGNKEDGGSDAPQGALRGEGKRRDWPKPVSKTVQLGLDDGQNVEILEGLEEGDLVLAPQQALPSAGGATNPFMPQRPRMPNTGGQRGGGNRNR